MKLTKRQQKIYNWLLSKPGYIKSSPWKVIDAQSISNHIGDIETALKQARVDYKQTNLKKKVKTYNPVVTANLEIPNIIKSKNFNTDNILVCGDTHFPFEREGYLEHLLKCQRDYNLGTFVHIGDVIDNAYSSFHETNPDGHSAGDELSHAIEHLQPYYKAFPKAKVTLGNHDLLINRKAFSSGLSKRWIKGLDEVLGVPGWDFDIEHLIHNVLFVHGTGTSGQNAAYNKALNIRRSVIQGHLHSEANIRFNVSKEDIIFAMQVGCGVDDRKYAFDYAKANPRKFIITCGAVLNKGKLPILIPMDLK